MGDFDWVFVMIQGCGEWWVSLVLIFGSCFMVMIFVLVLVVCGIGFCVGYEDVVVVGVVDGNVGVLGDDLL